MSEFVPLHIYAEDYDAEISWRLAAWCRTHGADEWTIADSTVKRGNNASLNGLMKRGQPIVCRLQNVGK